MSETRLVWEGALEPTGTLFLDDLRELEELLYRPDFRVEWTLEGKREIGSAKVTATTIDEVVQSRNRLLTPEALELHVRESDRWPEGGEFSARVAVGRGWRRHEGWSATVSASMERQEHFEQCVRGITAIFGRAGRTTWAREHETLKSMVTGLWTPALVGIAVFLWLTFRATLLAQPLAGLMFGGGVIFLLVGGRQLGQRLESNACWKAPPFDLRDSRSEAPPAEEPAVMRRDVVLAVASALVTLGGAVAIAVFD